MIEPTVTEHTAVHDLAVARHLRWAQDFAVANDLESALDELLDLQALKAELRVS